MQRSFLVVFIAVYSFVYSVQGLAGFREDEFGVGSISSALAGAGIATLTRAPATLLNPANLSQCEQNSVEAGFRFISTHFNVTQSGAGNEAVKQAGNLYLGEFGVCIAPIKKLGIGVFIANNAKDPIAIGITTPKTDISFIRFGSALAAPTLSVGVGYAFVPQLSLGLSVLVAMHPSITQDVYAPLTNNGRKFSTDIGSAVRGRAAVVAGFSFRPWDFLGMGATFRSANYSQLDINAKTQAAFMIPIPPIKVNMTSFYDYSPRQYGVGIFYRPLDSLTFLADLNYAAWSKYPGPFLKVTADPTSNVSSGIPLPIDETFSFKNILIPKVGAEIVIARAFAIRIGYGYHPAIVDLPQAQANLIDGDTHTISLGGGYKLKTETLGLFADLHVATHIMPKYSVQKNATNGSLAFTFDGIGISSGLSAGVDF